VPGIQWPRGERERRGRPLVSRADEALGGAAAREPAPPRLGQPADPLQALPRSRADPAPSSARVRNRLGAPCHLGVVRETEPTEQVPGLQALARVLYYSAGITKIKRSYGGHVYFRAAANTGARYHVDLYLACRDLADLPAGLYHFGVHDFALRRLRVGDYRGALITLWQSAVVSSRLSGRGMARPNPRGRNLWLNLPIPCPAFRGAQGFEKLPNKVQLSGLKTDVGDISFGAHVVGRGKTNSMFTGIYRGRGRTRRSTPGGRDVRRAHRCPARRPQSRPRGSARPSRDQASGRRSGGRR